MNTQQAVLITVVITVLVCTNMFQVFTNYLWATNKMPGHRLIEPPRIDLSYQQQGWSEEMKQQYAKEGR